MTGADCLVEHKLCAKLAPGVYTLLPRGAGLFSRIACSMASRVQGDVDIRILRVDRPAIRPGPRQLVSFHVLQIVPRRGCTAPWSAESALLGIQERLAEWGIQSRIVVSRTGLQLAPVAPSNDVNLRHTLAAAEWPTNGTASLTVGLEVLVVAMIGEWTEWNLDVAPHFCDLFVGRRCSIDLQSALRRNGVSFLEQRSDALLTPAAPVRIAVSGGELPIHIVSRGGARRFSDVEQAMSHLVKLLERSSYDRWQSGESMYVVG